MLTTTPTRNIAPFFAMEVKGIFRTPSVYGTFPCLDERMQRKRSFRRAPVWQKPQGPIISILREGARARLDFEYSPLRVAAVKAIKGAKYHPDDKSWSIPFESVDQILSHKEFPSFRSLNGLGEQNVTLLDRESAGIELRKNPFAVSEESLSALAPDVLVRMTLPKRRLRLIPRVGSTAMKVVKKGRGVTYSGSDSAFTIPVENFPELLKKLRDKEVVFAVDSIAGATLSSSAAMRSDIVGGAVGYSADQLFEACLTPFITDVPDSPGEFRPCYFTTEQFKAAFPGVSRKGGQASPFSLDHRTLLAFSARRDSLPFTVWMTKGVVDAIETSKERILEEVSSTTGPIDDAAADVVQLPFMWKTAPSGRAVLVIGLPPASDARRLVADRVGEVLGTEYESEAAALHIEVPDSRLLPVVAEVDHLCETNDLGKIPRSASFERLHLDVEERVRLRERVQFYSSLDDISPERVRGLSVDDARRLFPHQRVAIEWLREFPHAFLGDDMGLGKTLSVLSYFATLRREEGYKRLLVVCPNSLTRNWVREATNRIRQPNLTHCA